MSFLGYKHAGVYCRVMWSRDTRWQVGCRGLTIDKLVEPYLRRHIMIRDRSLQFLRSYIWPIGSEQERAQWVIIMQATGLLIRRSSLAWWYSINLVLGLPHFVFTWMDGAGSLLLTVSMDFSKPSAVTHPLA